MINIPPQVCKGCGTVFVRDIHHRLYCSRQCSTAAQKAVNAAWMKQSYWHDPVASRQKAQLWSASHRALLYESHRKSALRTCSICGAQRVRPDLPRDVTYICRACITRRKTEIMAVRHCFYCGEPIGVKRQRYQPHSSCLRCYGGVNKLAAILGLTRQRASHLVDDEAAQASLTGIQLTRPEAIELVKAQRGIAVNSSPGAGEIADEGEADEYRGTQLW